MTAWLVALAAGVVALIAALFAASRAQAGATAARELSQLREELEATRGKATKRSDLDKRRDEELAELRRRLEKTKRRASQARDDERQESERIRDLDEKVRLAQADARAMRAELQRVEAELARAREAPKPPPRPEPAPAVVVAPPAPVASPPDEALLRRAESAEARVLGLEDALVVARVDAERQRRKVAAQDRLYLAMRGELDAKKERLRAQQEELERLRALRLVLADDLVDPEDAARPGETTEVESAS
jgi:hypothetical protein